MCGWRESNFAPKARRRTGLELAPLRGMRESLRLLAFGLVATVLSASPAWPQLRTQHIFGAVGLKGGTAPPPHVYIIAPLFYTYWTDTVRNRNGDKFPINASLTSVAYAGGVNVVTSKKILGANYGFQILAPVGVNNRIQGTEIDQNPGAGISDSAFVPISLGWNFKRADAIASYTIFAPTGRYTNGATDNTGYGMWGHEVAVGTTVYLNAAKQYHAATVASFDVQSKKEDSETKVGNQMNLEGGVGADFLKGGLTTGLVYYGGWKLTDDQIDGFPNILVRGRNKVFALGPEVQLALAKSNKVYGFLKVNYQWEVFARTTTQGNALIVLATFLAPPLTLPTP